MNATWQLLGPASIEARPIVFLLLSAGGGLLLTILLLALIVTAVTQSRRAGVVAGLTLFGTVLSLVGVVFFFVPQRVSVSTTPSMTVTEIRPAFVERAEPARPTPAAPAAPRVPKVQMPAAISDAILSTGRSGLPFSSSDPWDGVVEDTLSASVYSSAANAARALAREAMVELSAQMAEIPGTVVVVLDPGLKQQESTLGTQVGAVLRTAFPLTSVVESSDESADTAPEQLVIRLDQPESQVLPSTGPKLASISPNSGYSILRDPDHWLPQAKGTVRLRAVYQELVFEGIKPYTDKPWADHFDQFVSSHPERSLLRADCRTFASEEALAYRDAVAVAVDSLLPRVTTLLRAEPNIRLPHVPEDRIRQQLRAAVERNELVADRFSQELEGRFGRVWRATLLIDFQPQQLMTIAHQGHQAERNEQRRTMATELAVVLMLGLVVALYIVLNELTKGYFVWNLRAAAMLALLTMVMVFCWWVG